MFGQFDYFYISALAVIVCTFCFVAYFHILREYECERLSRKDMQMLDLHQEDGIRILRLICIGP